MGGLWIKRRIHEYFLPATSRAGLLQQNIPPSRPEAVNISFDHEGSCRGAASISSLARQIQHIGSLVSFQRHIHIASCLRAELKEHALPVSVDETKIKRTLKTNGIAFELGYTCLIMDCIFCKFKKTSRRSDEAGMYVNKTTGNDRFPQ